MIEAQPLVTIVTPSYNYGSFIAECIESVLAQDYPRIEYIVMDGDSTDQTRDILRRYEGRITRIISEPDLGQGGAINHGFLTASGQIFGFLDADDMYYPQAISQVVAAFSQRPDAGVVYGNAVHVDALGAAVARYPTKPFDRERLRRECFICQPAAFIRRDVFQQAGGLNPNLHLVLDYDLWLRLAGRTPFLEIEPVLAKSRVHNASKSVSSRSAFYHEIFGILESHFGYVPYEWVQGYCSYLVDANDQFFTKPRRSWLSAPLALLLGSVLNKSRIIEYFEDWLAHRSIGAARRKA